MIYLVNIFIYGNDRQWGLVAFGGLSPLGYGIKKYAKESACDCQMVVTDKGFLLVPGDRSHWTIRGDLRNIYIRGRISLVRGHCNSCLGKPLIHEGTTAIPMSVEGQQGKFKNSKGASRQMDFLPAVQRHFCVK